MESKDELISKLKVIASIQPGQTFSTANKIPIVHNSWYTSFYRFYYQENGTETVNYIKKVFEDSEKMLHDKHVVDALRDCVSGLENLKQTYTDKKKFEISGSVET